MLFSGVFSCIDPDQADGLLLVIFYNIDGIPIVNANDSVSLIQYLQRYPLGFSLFQIDEKTLTFGLPEYLEPIDVSDDEKLPLSQLPSKERVLAHTFWTVYFNSFNEAFYNLISDCYNSRVTTIKNPEMTKTPKLVKPFKSDTKRSDLDGYGPTGKEVVQIGTHRAFIRDGRRQIGNG